MSTAAEVFKAAREGRADVLASVLDDADAAGTLLSWSEATGDAGLEGWHCVTPLVVAAAHGHADAVGEILRHVPRFDLDGMEQRSVTLWAAASGGHLAVVRVLVEEAGANVDFA
jgi:hypothetical protein